MDIPFAGRKVEFVHTVDATFTDFDRMAASPVAWDQRYEHVGRGRFHGRMKQVALNTIQIGRVAWRPGILKRGSAPANCWVIGFPVAVGRSLHIRGRQLSSNEPLLVGPGEDTFFVAQGDTDIPMVAIPDDDIERWMSIRRRDAGLDRKFLNRPWILEPDEMLRRGRKLGALVELTLQSAQASPPPETLSSIEAGILELVLGTVPSTERMEPLHRRARIALKLRDLLLDRREEVPLSVTAMCELLDVTERTLFLACFEAFGKPPKSLLLELRLSAVNRALSHPENGQTVTDAASRFGFTHFSRFSALYSRQFDELPSQTLRAALGSAAAS